MATINKIQGDNSSEQQTLDQLIQLAQTDETGEAQYRLGVIYRDGLHGVDIDHKKSTKWFESSSDWLHLEGCLNYIKHCYEGIGIETDAYYADTLLRELAKKALAECHNKEINILFEKYKKDLLSSDQN